MSQLNILATYTREQLFADNNRLWLSLPPVQRAEYFALDGQPQQVDFLLKGVKVEKDVRENLLEIAGIVAKKKRQGIHPRFT